VCLCVCVSVCLLSVCLLSVVCCLLHVVGINHVAFANQFVSCVPFLHRGIARCVGALLEYVTMTWNLSFLFEKKCTRDAGATCAEPAYVVLSSARADVSELAVAVCTGSSSRPWDGAACSFCGPSVVASAQCAQLLVVCFETSCCACITRA
jgi:hypothetical protein